MTSPRFYKVQNVLTIFIIASLDKVSIVLYNINRTQLDC